MFLGRLIFHIVVALSESQTVLFSLNASILSPNKKSFNLLAYFSDIEIWDIPSDNGFATISVYPFVPTFNPTIVAL